MPAFGVVQNVTRREVQYATTRGDVCAANSNAPFEVNVWRSPCMMRNASGQFVKTNEIVRWKVIVPPSVCEERLAG